MGERTCIVCGKLVPAGYETDHLRANHLGPHHFWFNAKKHLTMEPSMTIADIKKMVDAVPGYQVFRERPGDTDLGIGDSESVDLTNEPHFWAAPPATMWG